MKIRKAFQYELKPNGADRRAFARFAGIARKVWNLALSQPQYLSYAQNCKLLHGWKTEFSWMREAHSQILQQKLKDLDCGFKNFFEKRAERPAFKKKGKSADSFRFPQGFKIEEGNDRVYLPKIGWVCYRNSRALRGVAKNVTVSRKADRWFISIQTEFEVEQPVAIGDAVGIDLGVVRFATISDGTVVPPLNIFKRYATDLRKAQQAMARKKKFSNNWKKAQANVQTIHVRIANARRDFLHKTSTTISKNHAMVVMEDLQVSNMSRSAVGTVEQPGRKVRQKAGLNRAILDQGWAEFRRQLEYKVLWAGGLFIAVPPHNTSQTCPGCGHVSADNRKTQACFLCMECGLEENADMVGAINVLRAGHARLACQVNGEVSRQQQEPAEIAA
jgi:putative transposase